MGRGSAARRIVALVDPLVQPSSFWLPSLVRASAPLASLPPLRWGSNGRQRPDPGRRPRSVGGRRLHDHFCRVWFGRGTDPRDCAERGHDEPHVGGSARGLRERPQEPSPASEAAFPGSLAPDPGALPRDPHRSSRALQWSWPPDRSSSPTLSVQLRSRRESISGRGLSDQLVGSAWRHRWCGSFVSPGIVAADRREAGGAL